MDVSSSSLGSGGIAGIAVVVIILLIAILFGAVFYYRRKYKKAKVNRSEPFTWKIRPYAFLFICYVNVVLIRSGPGCSKVK